jgi:hypothetical protein
VLVVATPAGSRERVHVAVPSMAEATAAPWAFFALCGAALVAVGVWPLVQVCVRALG